MLQVLLYGLGVINLLTLIAFAVDKSFARGGRRRLSEASLCWLAAGGGAPAAWLAVKWFRHKSRKRSFQLKLALATLFCLVWLGALWWFDSRA